MLKRIATSAALAVLLVGNQIGAAAAENSFPGSDGKAKQRAGQVAAGQWNHAFPPSDGEVWDQMHRSVVQKNLESRSVETTQAPKPSRASTPGGGTD